MVRIQGARLASLVAVGALAFSSLAACGSDSEGGNEGSGDKTSETSESSTPEVTGKVGVILPDSKSSVRWETQDRPNLEAAFDAAGLESIIQNAEGSPDTFGQLCDQMITEGVNVLIETDLDPDSGKACIDKAKNAGGRLHLLGLVSDGGVHSHLNHLGSLIETAAAAGVKVVVHAFLDGRDVLPGTAPGYLETLEGMLKKHDAGVIGTVSGRYWAMDRDNRWERVERAFAGAERRRTGRRQGPPDPGWCLGQPRGGDRPRRLRQQQSPHRRAEGDHALRGADPSVGRQARGAGRGGPG